MPEQRNHSLILLSCSHPHHWIYCQVPATHCGCSTAQNTVDFPIGVLSDYKETVPEKNMKLLYNHCNHVSDTLIKFRKDHVHMAL